MNIAANISNKVENLLIDKLTKHAYGIACGVAFIVVAVLIFQSYDVLYKATFTAGEGGQQYAAMFSNKSEVSFNKIFKDVGDLFTVFSGNFHTAFQALFNLIGLITLPFAPLFGLGIAMLGEKFGFAFKVKIYAIAAVLLVAAYFVLRYDTVVVAMIFSLIIAIVEIVASIFNLFVSIMLDSEAK